MEWIKINEEGEIEFVSEEVKLVPEVQAILALNYNKQKGDIEGRKKVRAKVEMKYIRLVYSPSSPYKDYFEKERIEEAKADCGFPSTWELSEELKALIPKYLKGTSNRVTNSFNRALKFLEKLHDYLEGIDLDERTATGGLVYNVKAVMQVLEELPPYILSLEELEKQVRNGTLAAPKSKGDHEMGWLGVRVESTKKKPKQLEDEGEHESED